MGSSGCWAPGMWANRSLSYRWRLRCENSPLSSASRVRMLSRREPGRRGGAMLARPGSKEIRTAAGLGTRTGSGPGPDQLASRGMASDWPVPWAWGETLSACRAATVQDSISTEAVEATEGACWWPWLACELATPAMPGDSGGGTAL
ncbi:hypothetical protein MAPG_01342 [Magnaporthiopsis poae ATCC 64411]|uniref:Uncharacterized protein n=1 Tax=Magnaporthiopsis poae (strain ATCC 64411 / 73-15) TaxID=644358 RepID=A0A0C4DNG1_MAGP6|nr:hypothetical protein MAPG_01342 [Magnaporthiopsis poae ATCC 64411]